MTIKGKSQKTTVTIECDYRTCDRTIECVVEGDFDALTDANKEEIRKRGWEVSGEYPCQSHVCPVHAEEKMRENMTPKNAKRLITNGNFQSSIKRELRENKELRKEVFGRILEKADKGVNMLIAMFEEDNDPVAHVGPVKGGNADLCDIRSIFLRDVVGEYENRRFPVALDDIIEAYLS